MPGGLFGAAPEAQARDRMDGKAGGRANSSSVAGGIFGTDDAPTQAHTGGRRHTSDSSVSGGIFGGGNDGYAHGGGYGGGYTKTASSAWEGAAGGKATNAAQARDGHFRGGTLGQDRYAASTVMGGPPPQQMMYNPGRADVSGRSTFDPDFLSNLEAAEQRDDEEAQLLAQLQAEGLDEPASEEEAVIAAAEQLAEEMGLDDAAAARLEEQLLAKHRSSKQGRSVGFQPPPQQQQMPPQHYMPRANAYDNFDAPPQAGGGFADQFGAPADGFKPSSKVLAPPGGASSICFG